MVITGSAFIDQVGWFSGPSILPIQEFNIDVEFSANAFEGPVGIFATEGEEKLSALPTLLAGEPVAPPPVLLLIFEARR